MLYPQVHGNGTKPPPKETATKTTNMTNRQYYQQGPTHAQVPLQYGASPSDPMYTSGYVMLNGQNQPQTVGWQATGPEMYPMHQPPTHLAPAQNDPNNWQQQVSGWDQATELSVNSGFTAPAGLFFGLQSSAANIDSSKVTRCLINEHRDRRIFHLMEHTAVLVKRRKITFFFFLRPPRSVQSFAKHVPLMISTVSKQRLGRQS